MLPKFITRHIFRLTLKCCWEAWCSTDLKLVQEVPAILLHFYFVPSDVIYSCLANHYSCVSTFIIYVVRPYISQSFIVEPGGMENCNRIWCLSPFRHWFIFHTA